MSELVVAKHSSVTTILDKLLLNKSKLPLSLLSSLSFKDPNHDLLLPLKDLINQELSDVISLSSIYKGEILLVGESEPERDLIFAHLSQAGHKITITEDKLEALALLQSKNFDLIINNFHHPIQQIDFVKEVRSHLHFSHIPLLIASSIQEKEKIAQSIMLGAEDFLPPTLDPHLLQIRVNIWLENKAYRKFQTENLLEIRTRLSILKKAVECVDEGFAIFDAKDQLILCNQNFRSLYGIEEKTISCGITYQNLLELNYKRGFYLSERRKTSDKQSRPDGAYLSWLNKRLKFHENPRKPYLEKFFNGQCIEITEKRMPDGGTVIIYKDVTEHLNFQNQIQHLATHDPLTGLSNRILFEKALDEKIAESKKFSTKVAVIYIDLDGFKRINDTFGHAYGDYLLAAIGKRLEKCVRKSDLVARLGGDEFCVMTHKVKSVHILESLIERIQKSLCIPVKRYGRVMETGASIGAAIFPSHGATPTSLMSAADKAMYDAKRAGGNNYRFAK